MTDDRAARIARLFEAVLEVPEAERRAWLEARCADDGTLFDEVVSLLAHESSGFLEDPPHLRDRLPEDPESVGPYRIVERIGSGGMGVVYRAEQQHPVRREVALKLIKLGMDTEQVVTRFEGERQALALMGHPNIARVYDAGSNEQGRPYFVMEYVPGAALTKYCDDAKLGVRDRLELFLAVCDGVEHAHRKGVIHRDLKPSNVLVTFQDGQAVPKIIDFGIAKATDQRLTEATLYTELDRIVGTPEYMSPEQADPKCRDIDRRTDVYALGVILYELLTGALPFDPERLRAGGLEELRRRIREEEPPKPSTRFRSLGDTTEEVCERRRAEPGAYVRQLRGDLDWIPMKALDKDRARRYDSAKDLAADVRRFLENRPVEARPPGMTYRVGKFVRRHRLGVAAAAMVAVALAVGAVGTTLGFMRAKREAANARRAAANATELSRTFGEFIALDDPSQDTASRRIAKLDQAAEDLRAGDLEPEDRRRLWGNLGVAYRGLGAMERADRASHEALEISRQLFGPESREYYTNLNEEALNARGRGSFDAAIRMFLEALAIVETTGGTERDVAAVLNNLGLAHTKRGATRRDAGDARGAGEDFAAAQEAHERSLEIRERIDDVDPIELARGYANYGRLMQESGEPDGALEWFERSLEIRLQAYGPEHHNFAIGAYYVGDALVASGRPGEAVSYFEAACAIFEARQHTHLAACRSSLEKARNAAGM